MASSRGLRVSTPPFLSDGWSLTSRCREDVARCSESTHPPSARPKHTRHCRERPLTHPPHFRHAPASGRRRCLPLALSPLTAAPAPSHGWRGEGVGGREQRSGDAARVGRAATRRHTSPPPPSSPPPLHSAMAIAPHLLLPYARVAGVFARGGYEAAPASLARPDARPAPPASPKRGPVGGGFGGGGESAGSLRATASSTTSIGELLGMKRRNIAPAHGPRDAYVHPPTSSAEVGWRAHEAAAGSGFGATSFKPG
jgi:hypothetical protein